MQYTVRGSDGVDYGPVDLQTLKAWAADGRVFPDTLITDGLTNRQALAKDFSEIGLTIPSVPAVYSEPPQAQPYPRGYSVPNDSTRLWGIIVWLALAVVLGFFTRSGGLIITGLNIVTAVRANANDDKYGVWCLVVAIGGFLAILLWTYLKNTTGVPAP
ncbi:MAG TPA: hypothetical protein VK171_15925 [Fimbriimonas sp.]|nr:hypothetical protein [Fimbriimonas sp.]